MYVLRKLYKIVFKMKILGKTFPIDFGNKIGCNLSKKHKNISWFDYRILIGLIIVELEDIIIL